MPAQHLNCGFLCRCRWPMTHRAEDALRRSSVEVVVNAIDNCRAHCDLARLDSRKWARDTRGYVQERLAARVPSASYPVSQSIIRVWVVSQQLHWWGVISLLTGTRSTYVITLLLHENLGGLWARRVLLVERRRRATTTGLNNMQQHSLNCSYIL